MVKRTPTSDKCIRPKGALRINPSSDPLAAFIEWRKTKGPKDPNSYSAFIRENPDPNVSESSNVSERFQGLPREDTKKPTEGGKRRRKNITKSKSKKNKSKKNKSKKSKK